MQNVPASADDVALLAQLIPLHHAEDGRYLQSTATIRAALEALRNDDRPAVRMALRLNWCRLLAEWPSRRSVKVVLPEGWSDYWA